MYNNSFAIVLSLIKSTEEIVELFYKIKGVEDTFDGEFEEADDFTENSLQGTIMTYFKIFQRIKNLSNTLYV